MSNLMTDTASYRVLESQYGNFVIPALKLKVNGADVVKSMSLTISEIQVTLSLKLAGMAVFKIAGVYEEENHSFRSDVKSKFKLGTIVEVELGYLSTTRKVFKGYVAMLGVEFDQLPVLTVTLMDARRLMMTSGRKYLLHNVKNYSDAVKQVLGDYSKLCRPVVDATSDGLEKPVSQTTNDFDFITKELIGSGRTDREFFIVADRAYFRKPRSVKAPLMAVRYGRELQSFKVDFSYLDVKVRVMGYNPKTQAGISAERKVSAFLSQTRLLAETPVLSVADTDADSREKAGIRAEALAREREEHNCLGSGSTFGLPEIVPGRFLKVEALDGMLNNKYYISEVTHVMSEESFMTYFEISGVC
ncbi:MAG: hypothetical protein LIP16_18195 [Clostridium sp.]|nr:hypothetical protein [Clostridium sp.]